MIEIIPNWHPIFVHFTLALFSTSVGFYWLAYLALLVKKVPQHLINEFKIMARWCLWISALITVITLSAGFYAYYTVRHDAVSHAAMTLHRNWALPTGIAILAVAGWSFWRYLSKKRESNLTFLIILLFIQGSLLITAWLGGEVVYRYGIGVLSLPKTEKAGHKYGADKSNHVH